jgi:hypothetical protein
VLELQQPSWDSEHKDKSKCLQRVNALVFHSVLLLLVIEILTMWHVDCGEGTGDEDTRSLNHVRAELLLDQGRQRELRVACDRCMLALQWRFFGRINEVASSLMSEIRSLEEIKGIISAPR